MREESQSKWTIDEEKFKLWLGARESEFEPALDPVPTLKALVFLALLDQRGPYTYEELGKTFEKQSVVTGTIPVASLRVALSELGNILNRTGHRLEIRSFKDGQREVKFELVPRNYRQNAVNRIIFVNEAEERSSEIAEYMLENQSLPFNSLYYLPRSACSWVTLSSSDAEKRKRYEADAWERLDLNKLMAASSSAIIGIVGLASGEGLGEIELLRNVLADGYTVHYMALDLSPVLLVAHIETVREVFSEELKEGRLLCAGVLTNVFTEMDKALAQARARFVSQGVLLREDEFIPQPSAVLATYLGNCLGNDTPDRESLIFTALSKAFPNNRPLAILVGVSVVRQENGESVGDVYTREFDDFLLQTPHHLLNNIEILRSIKPPEMRAVDNEFVLPNYEPGDDLEAKREIRRRRAPEDIVPRPYCVSHGIEGHIYHFYYRLDFDLEMPRKKLRIPAGTEIALYTIIKYNMQSLVDGIQKRRFKVLYNKDDHLPINPNGVAREYAVFVAYLDDVQTS